MFSYELGVSMLLAFACKWVLVDEACSWYCGESFCDFVSNPVVVLHFLELGSRICLEKCADGGCRFAFGITMAFIVIDNV